MTRLASGDSQTLEMQNRRTRHGELRIGGCRKYDLGGGYRLVCIKHEGHLVAAFVGSHDDCDRWIENNRGFAKAASMPENPFLISTDHTPHNTSSKDHESEADYDDILMAELESGDTLLIFLSTGLFRSQPPVENSFQLFYKGRFSQRSAGLFILCEQFNFGCMKIRR